MNYLLSQMFWCLLIAFILGLIIGYLLCKIFCKCNGSNQVAADIDLDTNVDLDSAAYDIETLEGVGPKIGNTMRSNGIATVGDYLRKLHTSASRKEAVSTLGFRPDMIENWAYMSDLLRVDGVDHQYAELTMAAGVKTVGDLASSSATTLAADMDAANNAGKNRIAPTVPEASEVSSWIKRAKTMKAVVQKA